MRDHQVPKVLGNVSEALRNQQRLSVETNEENPVRRKVKRSGSKSIKSDHPCKRNTNKINDKVPRESAYRANLNGIRMVIGELDLNEDHKKIMKKTPFWKLFEAILDGRLSAELCRKSDITIVQIINAYDPATDGFKLGQGTAKITREDVASMFGIVDGSDKIILKHGCKDAVDMVNRGFFKKEKLTSASIIEAMREYVSRTELQFKEDVVRLLCAYLLHSLFFPTSTIVRWVWLEYVEDLEQFCKYDWCRVILDELMESIRQHHRKPRKVSGCVLVLLYWMCERTNLVKPFKPQEHLGCIKWRVADLGKEFRKTSLGDLKVDQVVPIHPSVIDENSIQTPNNRGKGIDSVGCMGQDLMNVEHDEGVGDLLRGIGVGNTSNGDGISHTAIVDNNARVIIDLRAQIARLTVDMEKNKEDHSREIEKKDGEIARLNDTVLMLLGYKSKMSDELTETVVHAVTQASSPVKQERSMINRLRTRKRNGNQYKDYDYECKRKRRTNLDDPAMVVEVEDLPVIPKEVPTRPLPIKNLKNQAVYRKLSKDGKDKLNKMWSEAYSSTPVWSGTAMGCHLFVDDIRQVIVDSALSGNVIDAYAEVLCTEQETRKKQEQGDCTQVESTMSYVFTCSFLPMLGCKCPEERKRVLEKMMSRTSSYRFLLFPIHFDFQWTLLVLDPEEGSWQFYNSLKERSGVDPHYTAAEQLKNQVEGYWKSSHSGVLTTQDCRPIDPVEDSPQQLATNLDCGVIVCYIMQQYFRHSPVAVNFSKEECHRLRSDIVEAFLSGEGMSWTTT